MDNKTLEYIKQTIAEGKLSKPEDSGVHPKVGALLVHGSEVRKAHRGEIAAGDHAEFTLFERKFTETDLQGSTLFTTLEPCTCRNHPKTPCANRVINRRVKKVFVGMLDPNPDIYGQGVLMLKEAGIEVEMFPPELAAEVAKDNEKFVEAYLKPRSGDPKSRSLDEWYHTVNSIFFNSNFYREPSSLFTHLVEIMGGLSLLATEKHKQDVKTDAFLAKAFAWWLALCGKLGIRSVEDLLWSKFPFVCPYCRKCPHEDDRCLEAKAKNKNPDWVALHHLGQASMDRKPTSLGGWQRMYGQIFPSSQTERYEMVFGRFTEELGELAEAIRIGGVMPGYFVSEAADVFAWLMKLTNVYEAKQRVAVAERGQKLEATMYEQYPDKCKECGNAVCNCPPLLPKTLGRIAHDGPDASLLDQSGPFMSQAEAASFFEVGSRQIVIGAHKFPVTAEAIQEAASIAEVVGKISQGAVPNQALRQLRAISDSMQRKAAANAVRDRDIGNLIRVLKLLSETERSPILAKIHAGQTSGLIHAIVSQFS